MNVILGYSSLSLGRLVRSSLSENKIKECGNKERKLAAKNFKSEGKNGPAYKNTAHSQPGGRRVLRAEWRRLPLTKASTTSP